jgi:hypothetical protein
MAGKSWVLRALIPHGTFFFLFLNEIGHRICNRAGGIRDFQRAYNLCMASWIIQLHIADALLGLFPKLDPACFVVGNIAPDSGIPDEKWETFRPPTVYLNRRVQNGR